MMSIIGYQYNGMRGQRLGTSVAGYPNGVYPCKDGYISVRAADSVSRASRRPWDGLS